MTTTTPIQQALLTCPFCGGQATILKTNVCCDVCLAQMDKLSSEPIEAAITAWNRRAALSQVAGEPVEPVAWAVLSKEDNKTNIAFIGREDAHLLKPAVENGNLIEALYTKKELT